MLVLASNPTFTIEPFINSTSGGNVSSDDLYCSFLPSSDSTFVDIIWLKENQTSIETDISIQETADIYGSCEGDWWTGCSDIYDGDWSSSDRALNGVAILQLNYSKPLDAFSSSLWQVKDGESISNLSINNSCWDYNPQTLVLRVESISNADGIFITNWSCKNTTEWSILKTTFSSSGNDKVYEESMIWDISNLTLLGQPILGGVSNSLILDSQNTSKYQNWSCQARLFNGTDWGSWVNSSQIQILEEPQIWYSGLNESGDLLNKEVYVWINASDDWELVSCNFTISSPSFVFYDQENATINDGGVWNSSAQLSNESGVYDWNVTCYDNDGLTNFTQGSWSSSDTENPSLSLDYPVEGITYSSNPSLNFYAKDDQALNTIKFTTNDWVTITTLDSGVVKNSTAQYFNYTGLSLADGTYTLILNVTDLADKVNSSNVTFTITTPSPPAGGGGGGIVIKLGENVTSVIDFDGRTSYYFTLLLGTPAEYTEFIRITNLGSQLIKGDVKIVGNVSSLISAEVCELDQISNCSSSVNLFEKESKFLKLEMNAYQPLDTFIVDGVLQISDEITKEVNEFNVGVAYPPAWKYVRAFSEFFQVSERVGAQIIGGFLIIILTFLTIFGLGIL